MHDTYNYVIEIGSCLFISSTYFQTAKELHKQIEYHIIIIVYINIVISRKYVI